MNSIDLIPRGDEYSGSTVNEEYPLYKQTKRSSSASALGSQKHGEWDLAPVQYYNCCFAVSICQTSSEDGEHITNFSELAAEDKLYIVVVFTGRRNER